MSSAVSSGSDTNNHKFRLPVPKRFHNNNKSQSKTERYFRNGVEEDESTIVMTPTQPPPPTRPAFVQSSSVVQPMDITMPVVVSTAELSPIGGGGGAVTDNVLRTIDLPKHSSPAAPTTTSTKNNTMMWDLELILGRTAMVAGLIMLVGEVFFGVSPLVSLVGNS
ncbi:unnamed protein product [Cylindrotheca closterium]|uniref:Uncharacterized protein n=1 Tax=Cylindrotheca closterium TaxID=2856 RepID=A0AAD2G707_9STRA|nr:unnamed protein product [Cylindrotheca closterium]